MRTVRRHQIIFTLINLFLAVSTIIVTIITCTQGTVAGQVDTGQSYGLFYLATFTMDSNILLGVVALIAAILSLKGFKSKKPLPPSITIWYLIATTAATLTFLTVVLFLAPKRAIDGKNYFDMLLGPMFFFHFFNPVLAAINLIFFAPARKLTRGDRLLSLAPMLIYALFYFFAVVVFEAWNDFYGFTFGGHNVAILPSFAVMLTVVYLIASLLACLHNRHLVSNHSRLSVRLTIKSPHKKPLESPKSHKSTKSHRAKPQNPAKSTTPPIYFL